MQKRIIIIIQNDSEKNKKADIMTATTPLDTLVPISDFNHGKASATFAKVRDNRPVTVLKNNRPACIVISPNDYERQQNADRRVEELGALVEELVNEEARREAREGEYVYSSDSVDDIMEYLNNAE